MNKLFKVFLFTILALGVAGTTFAGIGGPPSSGDDIWLFCDAEDDRAEGFVADDAGCWRVELKCDGGSVGAVYVDFSGETGEYEMGGADASEFGECFADGEFSETKQVNNKCEFNDGSKLEFQAQPADAKHCED